MERLRPRHERENECIPGNLVVHPWYLPLGAKCSHVPASAKRQSGADANRNLCCDQKEINGAEVSDVILRLQEGQRSIDRELLKTCFFTLEMITRYPKQGKVKGP